MTLAEIIRAQLATGRPLRVTLALLEALAEPPARRSLNDILPEAMRDLAVELERERDVMRRERDEARVEVERLRAERDEARESLAREQRRLSDRLDVDVLVGGASMHGADDALWRPGETRAECWARHIREAEVRGARWMHAAAVECSRYIGADHAMPKLNVQRICEAARKAGEHE